MKKSLATFLTIVLLLALAVPVLAEPEIVPFEFARTKTVKNVSGSEKVIIDDPNTKKDTDITCSWKRLGVLFAKGAFAKSDLFYPYFWW